MRGMRRVLWAAIATCAGALTFAAGASAQTTTIGNTSGSPSNGPGGCISACTDIPFSNVSAPTLVVPFDGKVTSYSLNEGSTGNPVRLRVLRSAGGGNFTAISSSPTHATV